MTLPTLTLPLTADANNQKLRGGYYTPEVIAKLVTMPPLEISQPKIAQIGQAWTANNGRLQTHPAISVRFSIQQ
jgi:hypothetical protein